MAWVMATAAGKRLVLFRRCGMRNVDIFRDIRCGPREGDKYSDKFEDPNGRKTWGSEEITSLP